MKRFRPILSIPVVYRNLFHSLETSTVTISLAESTIDYGDNVVITVSIPSDATGYVECIIGNEYYSKQLISTAGSNAVFTVSGLTTGTKPIVVNYLGNNEYGSCNGSSTITVADEITPEVNIVTSNITYGEIESITIYYNFIFSYANILIDGVLMSTKQYITNDKIEYDAYEEMARSVGDHTVRVDFYDSDDTLLISESGSYTVESSDPVITIDDDIVIP